MDRKTNLLRKEGAMLTSEYRYAERICPVCNTAFRRHGVAKTCHACSRSKERVLAKARKEANSFGFNWVAHRLVGVAIFNGFIPPASQFFCVDCGEKAREYDHRDYNKPLDVEPVCSSCNQKRSHGIPLIPAKLTTEVRQWSRERETSSADQFIRKTPAA